MGYSLADWMIYTIWAIFGLMIVDFLIVLFQKFWRGSFNPGFVLGYLKDILYYILPLNMIISMSSIDPTGYVLMIFYFIGGIAVIVKYVMDILKRFQT
ncbi:hypothetical protein EDM56_27525 [Brevibacillus fluminis]|uniref:Uncharacterized protein n=1 Tax=Brevibacillus fluminis TaxID=511487 RepID=A0A3M8CWU3_9BACL|nr:hypothetical protein [Brevibacillus fluminis]RNB80163.1 hypothetical protein EDM56_27525 [Brevibacillus fluminis]